MNDRVLQAISIANPKRKRSKYNAMRTILDGFTFHSKKEAQAWSYLKIRERAGEIRDLKRQIPFKLYAHKFETEGPGEAVHVSTYICDFEYWDVARGQKIVADAKGVETALFKIKQKMLRANYGIEVEIV